jgi:AcrR family transcriptional regulator
MSDDGSIPLQGARPTRADAVKNYNLLLDTARQLFSDRGVANVSMTELASEAHVGKGTLYRHFNNKAEVCYALLDHQQRQLQIQTLDRLRQQNNPQDDLRWFLPAAADFVISNLDLMAEGLDASGVSALTFPAHVWWRQTIRGLLNRLDVTLDRDYAADVLYTMLNVYTIQFQLDALGYSPDQIHTGLSQLLDSLIQH